MFKKIFYICSLLTLVACDKVDISKYNERVQNCYYENISDNNCTKNKKREKITLKFCQCTLFKKSITKVIPQYKSAAIKRIRNECAKKTGYTFCEKDTDK